MREGSEIALFMYGLAASVATTSDLPDRCALGLAAGIGVTVAVTSDW